MADVLLVVAAGPGLGAAVARRFARGGFSVGLLARSHERLEHLADEASAAGAPDVAVAAADVADEQALRAAIGSLTGRLGPVTALVFNASAYVEGSGLSLAADDLTRTIDIGVVAAMVSVQEVAAGMRSAGAGTVILTGSVAADRASTRATAVGVAKAGLRNLAMSLHKELEPDGVRVVSVTIRGMLSGPKALDLDEVAEHYWSLHVSESPPPALDEYPPVSAGRGLPGAE